MREKGLGRVKILVGGIIPPDDVVTMKKIGVVAVFTPGTKRVEIFSTIDQWMDIQRGDTHEN